MSMRSNHRNTSGPSSPSALKRKQPTTSFPKSLFLPVPWSRHACPKTWQKLQTKVRWKKLLNAPSITSKIKGPFPDFFIYRGHTKPDHTIPGSLIKLNPRSDCSRADESLQGDFPTFFPRKKWGKFLAYFGQAARMRKFYFGFFVFTKKLATLSIMVMVMLMNLYSAFSIDLFKCASQASDLWVRSDISTNIKLERAAQ